MTTRVDTELENKLLLSQWRDLKRELQPMLDQLAGLESQIKAGIQEAGSPVRISGASATIRNGYTRETWDGKALNGYAAVRPEILQFRSETAVKPAVVLKMEKE